LEVARKYIGSEQTCDGYEYSYHYQSHLDVAYSIYPLHADYIFSGIKNEQQANLLLETMNRDREYKKWKI
jgi:hypothetical protein